MAHTEPAWRSHRRVDITMMSKVDRLFVTRAVTPPCAGFAAEELVHRLAVDAELTLAGLEKTRATALCAPVP